MTRTTRPPEIDLAARFPEIAAFARTTVRLHPRPGAPSSSDSHLGGPLLWPEGEPWPHCGLTKDYKLIPEEPVPAVAIGQFYARDIPELPFPDGTDLLQVLWCPHDHEGAQGGFGPFVFLRWRDSAAITPATAPPPEPVLLDWDDNYLPQPCVLHPERVTEYPWPQVLPEQLRAAVADQSYLDGLSTAPGSKIGGWVDWPVTDLIPVYCPECASRMEFLLAVAQSEWDGRTQARWRPVQDEQTEDGFFTELFLRRAVRLFTCPNSVRHPVQIDRQ